jgi:L-iditol 2-dehydrogenase
MLRTLLLEPYKIQQTNAPVPVPKEGEVLIRLTMVGICGSDIHMFKNGQRVKGPITIGHEGIGVIEKIGDGVLSKRVNERVAIEPNIPCFDCPECWRGRGNICRNKRIVGVNEPGCFAEYISLPEGFVHQLPETISENDAVVIEPTAVALSALNRSKARPGDTIAVIGLGTIGMLLTHIALSLGYKVLFADLVESKINKAIEMGAIFIKGGNSLKVTAEIYESVFKNEDVAVLFECAGSDISATLAIKSAPRGVDIMLLGMSEEAAAFNPWLLLRQGNNIIPSLVYDHPFDFKRCIRLISSGKIQPGFIVSKCYPLEETQQALEASLTKTDSKIVIKIAD